MIIRSRRTLKRVQDSSLRGTHRTLHVCQRKRHICCSEASQPDDARSGVPAVFHARTTGVRSDRGSSSGIVSACAARSTFRTGVVPQPRRDPPPPVLCVAGLGFPNTDVGARAGSALSARTRAGWLVSRLRRHSCPPGRRRSNDGASLASGSELRPCFPKLGQMHRRPVARRPQSL